MPRRPRKLSIRQPVILFALVLVLAVTLAALWNFVLVHDYRQLRDLAGGGAFHTVFIVLGSALFLAIIVLCTILGIQLIGSVRWSQRQSNFLASVSHELNSPLSSVKLFAQTLQNENLSPELRRRFVAKILGAADRLSHMVANILHAQYEDRRGEGLRVNPVEVELRGFLGDYLEGARVVRAGEVEVSLEGDEAWVRLDRLMFEQVLDNLIDNSIRYRGPRPARVDLRLARDGDHVELLVADRGIGIPEELLERVFERFFRIETGEPETGRRGMGIGLSVVRSIVRGHGGTVEAESPGVGKGTTIRIRLPAIAKPGGSEGPGQAEAGESAGPAGQATHAGRASP